MKTNLFLILIADIMKYVQQLPAKVEMRPYAYLTKEDERIRIGYQDPPLLVNWEPITLCFSYDTTYVKNHQKKLGIPSVYRLSLELLSETNLKAQIATLDPYFIPDISFYIDKEGNTVKTIRLPKKVGKGRELAFDSGDEGEYKSDITDIDKKYLQKSLTIFRDRIKDYLKEISSAN